MNMIPKSQGIKKTQGRVGKPLNKTINHILQTKMSLLLMDIKRLHFTE